MFSRVVIEAICVCWAFSNAFASTVEHSIFGHKWFSSDVQFTGEPLKRDGYEFEWKVPYTHFENNGFVTHFDPVTLERGVRHKWVMGWNSYGMTTRSCPVKRYDGRIPLEYDCYDSQSKLKGDCRVQVGCTRDTGDFRVVLADSRGQKQTRDNFGNLANNMITGKWQGVEWRFNPHADKNFERPSSRPESQVPMPIHPMFKNGPESFEFFSTNFGHREVIPDTCTEYFKGHFGAPQNQDVTFSLEVEKLDDRKLLVAIEMNGIRKQYVEHFWTDRMMPARIDTFAITEPNQRGYRYLKIWDPKRASGHKEDWDKVLNERYAKYEPKGVKEAKERASKTRDRYENSSDYKKRKALAAKYNSEKIKPAKREALKSCTKRKMLSLLMTERQFMEEM